MKDYSLAERRYAILERLHQAGRVSVNDLSHAFGVSEVTIRADLQALATQNLVVRTHGGAIPPGRLSPDLSLALRRRQQVLAKDLIGEAGAAMVESGDAIFLDTSSTALAIARHLGHLQHVTVVTNSVAVVQELMDCPQLNVVMPGGRLRRETASLIGVEGLETLSRINIQKGFFGAHGLSLLEGLTDVSTDEADVKRIMVARSSQVIAVIDSTKWGRAGLASFGHLEDVDVVISDQQAPADLVEQARSHGVRVELV
jgi:DeoR/GlpR family transcriptional regulator of sugar metabolism